MKHQWKTRKRGWNYAYYVQDGITERRGTVCKL